MSSKDGYKKTFERTASSFSNFEEEETRRMDSCGGLEISGKKGGCTTARLVKELESNGIHPTHFLLINFNFDNTVPKYTRGNVNRKFFELIHNKTTKLIIHKAIDEDDEDDMVQIRWRSANTHQSSLYFAVSRIAETYMRQLTQYLVKNVFRKVTTDLGIPEDKIRVSYSPLTNSAYTIDLLNEGNLNEHAFEEMGALVQAPTPAMNFTDQTMVLRNPGSGLDARSSDLSSSEDDVEVLEDDVEEVAKEEREESPAAFLSSSSSSHHSKRRAVNESHDSDY